MENAYIEINGKKIEIPKSLTFKDIIKCEENGLSIESIEGQPFKSAAIILSVVENISVNEAIEHINAFFEEGGAMQDILTPLFSAFTNFFQKPTKKK